MRKATYTAGPWAVHREAITGDVPYVVAPDSLTMIADVNTTERHILHMPEDADANARLIAAAPEMLEALEAIIDSARDGRAIPEWLDERLVSAEAAIRKARGEQ